MREMKLVTHTRAEKKKWSLQHGVESEREYWTQLGSGEAFSLPFKRFERDGTDAVDFSERTIGDKT